MYMIFLIIAKKEYNSERSADDPDLSGFPGIKSEYD